MMTGLGVASLVVGSAIAFLAERYPRHQQSIQTLGGVLLIAGLAVLGYLLNACLADISHGAQSSICWRSHD
jgi:MFS family permease